MKAIMLIVMMMADGSTVALNPLPGQPPAEMPTMALCQDLMQELNKGQFMGSRLVAVCVGKEMKKEGQ